MSEICCTWLTENAEHKKIAKNLPSGHHRTTLSGCILATKACIDNWKKTCLLNNNISSTCPHNMVNVGPIMADFGLPVWSTPAHFNRFHILDSLLQRHHSPEANQTLHDVLPSPQLLRYIYIFGGSCPLMEFCQVHSSSGRQPNCSMIQGMKLLKFRRGHHLYSGGQPSHLALAHILV